MLASFAEALEAARHSTMVPHPKESEVINDKNFGLVCDPPRV